MLFWIWKQHWKGSSLWKQTKEWVVFPRLPIFTCPVSDEPRLAFFNCLSPNRIHRGFTFSSTHWWHLFGEIISCPTISGSVIYQAVGLSWSSGSAAISGAIFVKFFHLWNISGSSILLIQSVFLVVFPFRLNLQPKSNAIFIWLWMRSCKHQEILFHFGISVPSADRDSHKIDLKIYNVVVYSQCVRWELKRRIW